MTNEEKVKVVAAVIENEKEEVLCALRSNNMSLANLWEFPGGKVEEGEDIYSALVREIEEELHCKVKRLIYIMNTYTNTKHLLLNLLQLKQKS